MRWWKTLALIFTISITLSAVTSVLGLLYWTPLKSSMHASIRLNSADQLLKFARFTHRNVTYSFDVFWPLKPGKTEVKAYLEGIKCQGEGYTIEIVTMGARKFSARGPLSLTFTRKEPFVYFHVNVDAPPTCEIVPSKNGPVVVIDVKS